MLTLLLAGTVVVGVGAMAYLIGSLLVWDDAVMHDVSKHKGWEER